MAKDANEVKSYLVTLKSGDTGIFANDNHFENYPERLLSGMYSIIPRRGGDAIQLNTSTVVSVQEIESGDLNPAN